MIIVNTYSEYMAYFRSIADAHPDIKTFVSGDSDRILSMDRSSLEYPVLWVESPDINWNVYEGIVKQAFRGAFVVLKNAQIDYWQQEDFAMDICGKITSDIIKKISEDANEGYITIGDSKGFRSDPIKTYAHDNDHGFRTEVNIETNDGYCVDEFKDQSLCPLGTLIKFQYENAVAGDFSSLTITNQSLPEDNSFTYEWTWQFDEGSEQTSTDISPTITGSGNYLLVKLKATQGACVRYASIFINNSKNGGISVPYLLESKYI